MTHNLWYYTLISSTFLYGFKRKCLCKGNNLLTEFFFFFFFIFIFASYTEHIHTLTHPHISANTYDIWYLNIGCLLSSYSLVDRDRTEKFNSYRNAAATSSAAAAAVERTVQQWCTMPYIHFCLLLQQKQQSLLYVSLDFRNA